MAGVSHSRVEAFLSCQRKEYYSYHRKLERKEKSLALSLGSAGHACLEVLYRAVLAGGNTRYDQLTAYHGAVEAMWAHVDKMYAEGWTDSEKRAPLRLILEKYLQQEPFIDNQWMGEGTGLYKILAVEKEFNLEWDPETGASYPFVIDLIVEDPEGRHVVVDNKFLYDLYRDEDTDLMPQIPKYIGALRALGYKVASYGLYNMLRTRPDTKAGRPLYEWAFCMEIKVTSTRVVRTFDEQIVNSQAVAALDELDDETRDLRAVRTHNKETCTRMCDFKALCVEELRGGNVALVLTAYQPKTKREVIEISEEV